jgi:enoyl-CoA hydratase/carnithine racemase
MAPANDINIRVVNRVGRITLDRPKALNALTHTMCTAIESALDEWIAGETVDLIVIDGEGDRAFCAGGDIVDMYHRGKAGDFDYLRRFWQDEYRLNGKIANCPIPYVAIMDGITMGGGVGISAHGSDRIVTERSMIAMPECAIGLVPDVGGTFILSRAPGYLGEYLAATGYRMGPGDAALAGFADVQTSSAEKSELIEALEESADLSVIAGFGRPADEPTLGPYLDKINQYFAMGSALECLNALEKEAGGDETCWEAEAAKLIRRNSPISVACSFEMIRQVRAVSTIEEALTIEYRFTYRSMSDGDFMEGVRAQIIDKDRNPKWKTGRIEDVTSEQISAMLVPLGNNELN